jgi:hypothetical protein
VQVAELRAENNQMTYERESVLVHYENTPEGLLQSFVLQKPEVGGRNSEAGGQTSEVGNLELRFEFPGNVKARVNAEGTGVDFVAPDEENLATLGNYRATDAAGRKLPVTFAGGGDEMSLRVQADGAEFPIKIWRD